MQEDVQAWVDFQHPATRRDALVEMIEGLTAEMRPKMAGERADAANIECAEISW
jgi:hypothetical protein